MNKLEVGMYVRTKDGYIAKCTYFDNELENIYGFDNAVRRSFGDTYDFIYCNEQEECISKASNNIIDLIEVGDYVNGSKVSIVESEFIYWEGGNAIQDKFIETIVTKEQFKSMEYGL